MSAPRNNQFWKNRSKHGRDRLFKTSKALWKAAQEYFEWVDKHPWYKNEWKDGKMRKIPTARPYTVSGLSIYLNTSESYWREFRKNENLPEDFLSIIANIENIIRTQKFEGAATGAFNSNIIARDLGMVDKTALTDAEGNSIPLQTFRLPDNNRALNNPSDGSDESAS